MQCILSKHPYLCRNKKIALITKKRMWNTINKWLLHWCMYYCTWFSDYSLKTHLIINTDCLCEHKHSFTSQSLQNMNTSQESRKPKIMSHRFQEREHHLLIINMKNLCYIIYRAVWPLTRCYLCHTQTHTWTHTHALTDRVYTNQMCHFIILFMNTLPRLYYLKY